MGQYRLVLFCRSAENYKIKARWNFLNTWSYGTGNFKVLFLPQVSLEPIQIYENIAYHGKSTCLLEYCNEKFASST